MNGTLFAERSLETNRHRTGWIEDGPLIIFLRGWPELGLIWRAQIKHFATLGWRCVAPNMRGYGRSSRPASTAAYAVRELVQDMVELHDALGGTPAVWVGHDWESAVAWSMASYHVARCLAIVNLCVPYFARGFAMPNLVALIDRGLYPEDRFPFGQWDYWLFYQRHFARASREFEADVTAMLALLYRTASARQPDEPAFTADICARDGWFGSEGRAPKSQRDERLLSQGAFDALVAAFSETGFTGADAWYMNDADNIAYAAEASDFGRLSLPTLFIHAANDAVCDTTRSRLAEPMREDCERLKEVTLECGHEIMRECPEALNSAIADWLVSERVAEWRREVLCLKGIVAETSFRAGPAPTTPRLTTAAPRLG